ncbi:hypothetical protein BDV95DRAFT_559034 [Massariosphaeria phaeospora]|uniref:Uncharacterized protein n=1 Tax=Massariosphaeria phaeospora TaxID=100035 RepID=A0A7C8MUK9_9PLEO|nr:hypothetical protein BDV95DRAFT_559034 [Massariosphaeria phaeospora]
MGRLLNALTAAVALATVANAGVEFTSPTGGGKFKGAQAVKIEWKDGGSGPKLSELTTYTIMLCAGSNAAPADLRPLTLAPTPLTFAAGNEFSAVIDATAGESTTVNAYFFKMIAVAKTGTITYFSPRFSLSGMSGTFPAAVKDSLKDVKGTAGPDTIDASTKDPAAVPEAGDFGVEYTLQTGLTRYAPMQPVPATKITKKNAAPLHPTSAFTIAKTWLPIPSVQTTITQSQTFSQTSRQNPATPAPMPSDDMAKFLARWKD